MKQLVVLMALCSTLAFAQERDFSKVEMKVQKVAGNVYMLQGAGGNIGVSVGEDGVLVIDDEYAPLAPKIKEAIKSISDKPVRWINLSNDPRGVKRTRAGHEQLASYS